MTLEQRICDEAHDAHKAGLVKSDNPYTKGSVERESWEYWMHRCVINEYLANSMAGN